MSTAASQPIYIELTKHTLLMARARGAQIELFRECSLDDKDAVEEAFAAFDPQWKTNGFRAISAVSPLPVYWHLATVEEPARYRTEAALRQLSAALPHPLTHPLELTACHAADGSLLSTQGSARWLLGLTPSDSLTVATASAAEWRIDNIRTESATLSHLGAISTVLRLAGRGSVALWDLAVDGSQLFLVTPRGVEAVVPCAVGLEEIFVAVRGAGGLDSRSSAVRLFFNETHDFREIGPKLAAHLAPALRSAWAQLPPTDSPLGFACTALTGKQAWFVSEAAQVVGVQPWKPDMAALCDQLKVEFRQHGIEASLTPSCLGLLHLVSSHAHQTTAWHPAWTRAGVTPLALAPVSALPVAPAKPAPPKMSDRTIACLRDEAYAHLCRQSLTEALATIESEKEQIISTRPPFGMLATKKARETYETSLNAANHSEAEYRQKLQQVDQLEHWLQSTLQEGLHDYLTVGSAEYQGYNDISVLVERWQNAVGALHELALALARDSRAAAAVLGSHTGGRNAQLQTVANLRETAANLHAEVLKIARLTSEVTRLAEGKLPAGSLLPPLPSFRHNAWVDQIVLLKPAEAVQELQACEAEARAFCGGGKNDLLLRAEKTRSACLKTRLDYLNKYWDQLRAHALQHYVESRDVDEVLAELTRHYVASDLKRRQREGGIKPFASER